MSSRLTPSVTVSRRATAGPGGMIRTQAAAQIGWPSHAISTGTIPVRIPSGSRTFTCWTPSLAGTPMYSGRPGTAVDGHRHMVEAALVGQRLHPQRERRQRAAGRRHGFAGVRIADAANGAVGSTRRPASERTHPAGRLRQVIHMYCV
jgi:hypothetical protein